MTFPSLPSSANENYSNFNINTAEKSAPKEGQDSPEEKKYDSTPAGYNAYKIDTKSIKSDIKELENKINSASYSTTTEPKEIEHLTVQLKRLKQLNPNRLKTVETIYSQVQHLDVKGNLKSEIHSAVFELNKDKALKIDLKDKGFFVIKKGTHEGGKVIEIAMRTDEFARGGNGILYNLKYLHEGGAGISEKAFKIAKNNKYSQQAIINEEKNLKLLDGTAGIQGKAYASFDGGLITEKMMGDGDDLALSEKFQSLPMVEKQNILTEAYGGLDYLQEMDIYHGDIKPGNMLFNDEGKLKLVLADFGGVRKFSDIIKKDSLPESVEVLFGTHTSMYVSEKLYSRLNNDLKIAEKLIISHPELKDAVVSDFNNKAEAYLRANDQFAFGLALYSILTASEPPSYEDDERSNLDLSLTEDMKEKFLEAGVPQTLIDIVLALTLKGTFQD